MMDRIAKKEAGYPFIWLVTADSAAADKELQIDHLSTIKRSIMTWKNGSQGLSHT